MGDSEVDVNALLALRRLTTKGQVPERNGDKYVFEDGVEYDVKTNSGFKQYPLDALVYFFEKFQGDQATYRKTAHEAKVKTISILDQKDASAFLKGEIEWSTKITVPKPSEDDLSGKASSKRVSRRTSSAQNRRDKGAAAEGAKDDGDGKDGKENEERVSGRKRKSPEEVLLHRVKKREGCARDRNSVLLSSHRFTEAIRILAESKKKKKLQRELERKKEYQKTAAVAGGKGMQLGCPIIVVPAVPTAPINMYNVREFLTNGRYQTVQEARMERPIKEAEIHFDYQLGDHGYVRFKVVDSVKKFTSSNWDRLAAVLTIGKDWQFKDWLWKDTATIFDKCRGIHVYFDDAKLAPYIKNWNVGTFPIKKQSRHQDAVATHKIWGEIQRFLENKKPDLLQAGKNLASSHG